MATKYDFIDVHEVQMCLPVMKNEKWGLVSYDDYDQEVYPTILDTRPIEMNHGFIQVENKAKVGLLDKQGQEIIPVIYEYITVEEPSRIVVERVDDRQAIFDCKGKEIIPFTARYERLEYHDDNMIIARKNGKVGVINLKQEIIIPFDYQGLHWYSNEKLFDATKNDLNGVINLDNKVVIDFRYNCIYFESDHIIVDAGSKQAAFDYEGHRVIGLEYDTIDPAGEQLFIVTKDNLSGLVSYSGRVVLEPQYCSMGRFINGYAQVSEGKGRFGFINKEGSPVGKRHYDRVMPFEDGMAGVSKADAWGFIDETGKLVVQHQYDSCKSFSNGYAIVGLKNKYTLIDKEGNEVIPRIYDSIYESVDKNLINVEIKGIKGIVKL